MSDNPFLDEFERQMAPSRAQLLVAVLVGSACLVTLGACLALLVAAVRFLWARA